MKIIDFYFNLFIFLGIFKSKKSKGIFDIYLNLIYRIFIRIFPHLLIGWHLARLIFNKLSFNDIMETLMFTISNTNHVVKGIFIMIKQNQLEELKQTADTFMSRYQNKDEKDIHKRNSHFLGWLTTKYELSKI